VALTLDQLRAGRQDGWIPDCSLAPASCAVGGVAVESGRLMVRAVSEEKIKEVALTLAARIARLAEDSVYSFLRDAISPERREVLLRDKATEAVFRIAFLFYFLVDRHAFFIAGKEKREILSKYLWLALFESRDSKLTGWYSNENLTDNYLAFAKKYCSYKSDRSVVSDFALDLSVEILADSSNNLWGSISFFGLLSTATGALGDEPLINNLVDNH
jgi:hypothetical protein